MHKSRLPILALGIYLASALVFLPAAAADPEGTAQAFLAKEKLDQAARSLQRDELQAIGRTLELKDRRLTDQSLANLLRNPVAYTNQENSRVLLRTLLKSLPEVAATEGINGTLKLAANNNASNFRGFGTEIVASAALNRYSEGGQRAKLVRMGSMIEGIDGKLRESDGAVLLSADRIPRLVTIKSVSTEKAVSGSMKKAAKQLCLRNPRQDGSRTPGVILVGYDSPVVLEKLQRKDWQAAANRSGAKLLVLAVDQRTGLSKKLASAEPNPRAQVQAKQPRLLRPSSETRPALPRRASVRSARVLRQVGGVH